MRLVLYTGKGGVGKTTTSAATAVCASRRGLRTLVASADAAHSLGDVLETRLGAEPRELAPGLHAMEIDARVEMERHWGAVREYLVSIFRWQGIEEVVAEELALLPGAEELSILLGVQQHAREGGYDLVVVDCAPTGSALRLLTLPEVARSTFRLLLRVQQALARVVTPLARNVLSVPLPDAAVFRDTEQLLFRKLQEMRALVTDVDASVRLVLTPERMVIDEALRAHTDLSLFELPCDAVVMNRLLPEAAVDERFFQEWGRLQVERRAEVEELFAPLPVLAAPLQRDEVIGLERLAHHGDALFADHAPEALLCSTPGLRFAREGEGYRIDLPLPHVDPGALDVAKLDGQLVIASGERRRCLPLPRLLRGLALDSARLEGGELVVRLAAQEGLAPLAAVAPEDPACE